MTIETYEQATKILELKRWLEELLSTLDPNIDNVKYNYVNHLLFKLGEEFESL